MALSGLDEPLSGPSFAQEVAQIRELTSSETKAQRYAEEVYFREAWAGLSACWASPSQTLEHSAMILLKPDGLVSRAVEPAMDLLTAAGFAFVGAELFRFDRLTIRELWRYQLNVATQQRLAAIDLLLPATPSLLVLVRHEQPGATARLRALKGPAQATKRRPGQLRYELGAGDGLLNWIHTPDEPADFVRELGVLLPANARRVLLEGKRQLRPLLDELYAEAPPRELIPSESLAAVTRSVDEAGCHDPTIRGLLLAAQTEACVDWQLLLERLTRERVTVDPWDAITIAAAWTRRNRANHVPICDG